MKNNDNIAWCVIGDFNVMRYSHERQGIGQARANRLEMEGFNNFIVNYQLLDLLVVGTAKSRLDRALVSHH